MSQALKLPVITCLVVGPNKCVNNHIVQISNELSNLKIVAVCEDVTQSCESIQEEKPNVVFWDKAAVCQSSIDCLKKMRTVPQIVLLSNPSETTMDLPDYLVTAEIEQPFEKEKFTEVMGLIVEIQEEKEALFAKKVAPIIEYKPVVATVPDYIFLRTEGRVMRFDLSEILFFHGHGEYVIVKTIRGDFRLNTNMKKLAVKLEHPLFLKTHRAFVINVSKINHIEENEVIIGADKVLISRAHKAKVKDKLNIV
jgi:DNA-binding LytR/AlgR family response regulator